MRSVQVCLSPALLSSYSCEGKTVVVTDVLRATTTMAVMLQTGVSKILPVVHTEEALPYREKGWKIAAERNGQKVDNFDFGNSPFEFMNQSLTGQNVVISTTNGTRALHAASSADVLLAAAFVNLEATAEYIRNQTHGDIMVLCSGWKDNYNLEDSLFAGALAESLQDVAKPACDASLSMLTLYKAVKHDLFTYLQQSSHFNRLERLNIVEDVRFCLKINQINALPKWENGFLINAI